MANEILMQSNIVVYVRNTTVLAEVLSAFINLENVRYSLFTNEEKALEAARDHSPDVVFFEAETPEELSHGRAFSKLGIRTIALSHELTRGEFQILPLPLERERLAPFVRKRNSKATLAAFGPFDIYVEDNPVEFHSKKAKELLALMVAYPSSTLHLDYIISVLWPSHDPFLAKRLYRDASYRLRATLKEAGAPDLVNFGHASCRIDRSKATCDYWAFLENKDHKGYYGEFMSGYAWAAPLVAKLNSITA